MIFEWSIQFLRGDEFSSCLPSERSRGLALQDWEFPMQAALAYYSNSDGRRTRNSNITLKLAHEGHTWMLRCDTGTDKVPYYIMEDEL